MPKPADAQAHLDPGLIPKIVRRLETRFGVPVWRSRQDAVSELVACILSQHTSDINSLGAFDDLKRAFPGWDSVLEAPTEAVARAIWGGGLANSKAPRIQGVLAQLKKDQGRISLDNLNSMSDTDAAAYLMGLPGVGPKTAAIVLCFALGRNVMPVDTHIFRVSWRLGLIEKRIGEARAHGVLQALVPDELTYRYHVALINHGRQVCKAISPRCRDCILADICRWNIDERGKRASG